MPSVTVLLRERNGSRPPLPSPPACSSSPRLLLVFPQFRASGGTSAVATPMQEPQIASLFSASTRYGPSEAGKRVPESIVITVSDSSGAPIAGARWRWRTDTHAGWVYPPTGTTAADGRIAITWVAGAPGAGVLTLTVENSVSSMTAELATTSVASPRPPSSAVSIWVPHDGRATGYSIDLTPLTEPPRHLLCGSQLGWRLCRLAARRVALRPPTPVFRLGRPRRRCCAGRCTGRRRRVQSVRGVRARARSAS